MTRKKQPVKAKEPVKIRFKQLANGNQSIYLDIYRDGKRVYEFLKLYLIPDTDNNAKAQNANTMQAVNAIKSQRIIEMANDEAGISKASIRQKMLLSDLMTQYYEYRLKMGQSVGRAGVVQAVKLLLTEYKGDKVTMKDIDKNFCLEFADFLKTHLKTVKKGDKQKERQFKNSTVQSYFSTFTAALNYAVKKDIITSNPIAKFEREEKPTRGKESREYLTIEEVKRLIATDIKNDNLKRAFLFSCFCGLRYSDIKNMKWSDITMDGKQYKVAITMQKTKEPLHLPLSNEAVKWLPEKSKDKKNNVVFDIVSNPSANALIAKWTAKAGIEKKVTFHTARHTFATMMITLNVDLYTVSKLLGHGDISATQIYADIIDKKKEEAVNLANDIFK